MQLADPAGASAEKESVQVHTTEQTVIVVGASRGLGRGVATAFAEGFASVIAVSRNAASLGELAVDHPGISVEVGDAVDDQLADRLLTRHQPTVVILVAGAMPPVRPFQQLTWEEFSVNWRTDVRAAFVWVGVALRKPMPPGSHVVLVSSRAGLGLTFTTVLPMLTPATELGREAIRAYAARNGQTEGELVHQLGRPLTPKIAGEALVGLVTRAGDGVNQEAAYILDGTGLQPLPSS